MTTPTTDATIAHGGRALIAHLLAAALMRRVARGMRLAAIVHLVVTEHRIVTEQRRVATVHPVVTEQHLVVTVPLPAVMATAGRTLATLVVAEASRSAGVPVANGQTASPMTDRVTTIRRSRKTSPARI